MTDGAGVLRSAESLRRAAAALEALYATALTELETRGKTAVPGTETWEATNLLCVARVLVAAAQRRAETRGCHWREDHPDRNDTDWRRHLVVRLSQTERRALVVTSTDSADFPSVRVPLSADGTDSTDATDSTDSNESLEP